MEAFEIKGPAKLRGEITPQGAKNEALQVLAAVLLTNDKVTIKNLPDIQDINKQIELLAGLGVDVERLSANSYSFKANNLKLDYLDSEEFYKLGNAIRGSVLFLGPLLGRFGRGVIPKPGGDKIGRRKLDTHFLGLQRLGADFIYDTDKILLYCYYQRLKRQVHSS
jgi:UDP-N-acetylglucosamine 1-carboxyvinyltransferase